MDGGGDGEDEKERVRSGGGGGSGRCLSGGKEMKVKKWQNAFMNRSALCDDTRFLFALPHLICID